MVKVIENTRLNIAKFLIMLASYTKALGKLVHPTKGIVCDILTLPGWAVIDNCMIKQIPFTQRGLRGFEWHVHDMPEEWCQDMAKMKRKVYDAEKRKQNKNKEQE